MCSCGCNKCDIKKPNLVLENKRFSPIISEGLTYLLKENKPLSENLYRYGSPAFLALWKEARTLYSRGIIDVYGVDREILTETHLGEYGYFEGKKVPLDVPMISEETVNEVSFDSAGAEAVIQKVKTTPGLAERLGFKDYSAFLRFLATATLDEWQTIRGEVEELAGKLAEAEYQGKTVQLNKPKRGGAKKFYVYVKDPKTKNVRKVQFGDAGNLKVKIDDPEARRSFAARHDCKNKKDKTKAGYWSCNIGRYWKSLGGSKNFSGYW